MSYKVSRLYRLLLREPPLYEDGSRRIISILHQAFWNGYDGSGACLGAYESSCWIAWRAGQDHRRQEQRVQKESSGS